MGAKLFRCIGVIPNLSRAKRCCFVPYPEFFSQKYPGYLTDNSSIILSLYTFAIIDAAAIDRDLLSPLIIGYLMILFGRKPTQCQILKEQDLPMRMKQ